MICNELYRGQGLGNQLWNYAVTRIIAKNRQCDFAILGRERFKGRDFIQIDFGKTLTGGISPDGGPPEKLPGGITHYYRERQETLLNTSVNISRTDPDLLQISAHTKFDGNCQSTKYLAGHRDDILTWIKIQPDYLQTPPDENTCIIHVRGGDFRNNTDVFLPSSYYLQAMEQVRTVRPAVQFYCVTDEIETAKKIVPGVPVIGSALMKQKDLHRASHHVGGPIGIDFALMMQARYVIIPNSSFSWWPAYLNTRKALVIAPKYWARYNTSDGFWSAADIITDGFSYLDQHGNLFSSQQCWDEKERFEAEHEHMFQPATLKEWAPPPPEPSMLTIFLHHLKKSFRI